MIPRSAERCATIRPVAPSSLVLLRPPSRASSELLSLLNQRPKFTPKSTSLCRRIRTSKPTGEHWKHRQSLVYQCYVRHFFFQCWSTIPDSPKVVHLVDAKKTHNSCDTIIKKAGHPDMVNFGLYHDLHDQIRQMLSFQHPPLTPTGGAPLQNIRMFISTLIRPVVVDDAFRKQLDKRAAVVDREEHADFVSHIEELKAAGFIRST